MSRRELVALLLYALWTSFTPASAQMDMCATFTRATTDKSMEFVTPGYLENRKYPNNSYCRCDIYAKNPNSRARSLNITMLDLQMEVCSTSRTPYDTFGVTAAYKFETLYKKFTLCGTRLPLSRIRKLQSNAGLYGQHNTIFSVGFFRLEFKTDLEKEYRGIKFRVDSYQGMMMECEGVSGPLPEPTALPTIPLPATTEFVGGRNRWDKEVEDRKKSTDITAALVGTFVSLFAVGAAVAVFLIIRRHRANHASNSPTAEDVNGGPRRQSDGRPIYRDPCQGQPHLPLPGSVRVNVSDEYLYMKGGLTTPVYENPQLIGSQLNYVNEEMNGKPGRREKQEVEEEYQDGYIIPGCAANGSSANLSEYRNESAPLLSGLVLTGNKPPIPEPKGTRAQPVTPHSKLNHTLSDDSAGSGKPLLSQNNSPLLNLRHETEASRQSPDGAKSTNNKIYEPSLVKPSDMKAKAKATKSTPPVSALPKPKTAAFRLASNPPPTPPQKPAVKLKPVLKNKGLGVPPPLPPNKPGKPGAAAT